MLKLFIIVLIIITTNNFAQNISFSGNISTNTTWNADTVEITGNVIINNGITLNINAGTYIEFQSHYLIYVSGTILANGEENNIITFTSADTTGFNNQLSTEGSWFGFKFININESNDSSKLSYCKVKYVKDLPELDSIKTGGAIIIENSSKIRIENCVIENNKAESEYYYNGHGGAIALYENSNPIIKNNTLRNNFTSGYGGAIYCEKSNPKIISNKIYNNIAGNNNQGSGGGLHFVYCDGNYTNDTIVGEIVNNLIYNNISFEGGGMYSGFSSATFLNNTICNNYSVFGGGIYTQRAHPLFINSILYNNTATEGNQVYINHDASICTPGNNPFFIHSNLQGGINAIIVKNNESYSGTYENNFDVLPMFVNETTHNYKLLYTSPLINKGKSDSLSIEIPTLDLEGNSRIFNDTIDIGAYEYISTSSINEIDNLASVSIYPNPSKGKLFLKTINGDIIFKKIEIIDITGKVIISSSIKDITNSYNLNLSVLLKGIYFVRVETNFAIIIKKIVIE